MQLNLLVLRCRDIEQSRAFYERLGLVFEEEQHGKGPRHYACDSDSLVLELYPASPVMQPDDIRLGFSTPSLNEFVNKWMEEAPEVVVKPLHTVADRFVIVLRDPDGRRVELSQSRNPS